MNSKNTTHPEIWLIRHGETEWSLSGQHTGRTDIPLTENGRRQAAALKPVLAQQPFDLGAHTIDQALQLFGLPEAVTADIAIQQRAESLIDRLLTVDGRIALFAHAHILRVLAGCWMADDARLGAHLVLGTASVSKLGFEREDRAITQWNALHG